MEGNTEICVGSQCHAESNYVRYCLVQSFRQSREDYSRSPGNDQQNGRARPLLERFQAED